MRCVALLAAAVLAGSAVTTVAHAAHPAPPVAKVADGLAARGATSAIVLVSDHGHIYGATAGKRHPTLSQRFRIGSITKTFTAALVMQLVQEKRLRLDDTLSRYLPGVVPADGRITIRDLLQHTSGLADYTDDAAFLRRAERAKEWQPLDTLRFAASKPLLFPPGTLWSYSNTNFVALGLILEKVTGRSYGALLRQRILVPLRLAHTELPTTAHVPGIADAGDNPRVSWADGALVSNASDVARFFSALLGGRLLSSATLARMERTVPVPGNFIFDGDGLGIFSSAQQCGRFWGHNGGIVDSLTGVLVSPDGSRVAVVAYRAPKALFGAIDTLSLLCF